MPRKISFINELTDEAAVMAAEYYPMCGAVRGELNETDRTERKDSELIRKIAQLFMEDKTTLHVILYMFRTRSPRCSRPPVTCRLAQVRFAQPAKK